ncbi:MAG: Maf family nucleotide pyrophosphatase [Rikenellaceae bacterium]|nr:Maf family nucleotide pyrophosphatase [Rikenellaceae bacterium]MCL2692627.1 Maf family nucleotide pyrophosphatase [Rikenellaceae bacterium]
MLLQNKLKSYKLILASRSPRRRELLGGAGLEFTVADDFEVEEVYPPQMPPRKVPQYLAELKSRAYPATLANDEILITADTVVILDGEILGKPANRNEAIKMLESLSGREHVVVTGVCLRSKQQRRSFSAVSRVTFRPLSAEEIEYYVDNCRPYDKAGAYGIQEWIGYVGIRSIRGSFYNVMGLPVEALFTNLAKFTHERVL